MQEPSRLTPLGILGSALFMGIPGLLLIATVRLGVPLALAAGVPLITAFLWALYGPLGLLIVVALIAYRVEGHPFRWAVFEERMRLRRLDRRGWLLTIGATLLVIVLENVLLEPASRFLAGIALFAPPEWLPAPLNPLDELEFPLSTFLGVNLNGAWWVPMVFVPCLLANILGEELLWRGYMLPRQELAFGKWAWLVNGAFWLVLFHAFMPWIFISVLPTMTLVPYLTQRLQSTWCGIVIHGTGNLLFLIMLIISVASA